MEASLCARYELLFRFVFADHCIVRFVFADGDKNQVCQSIMRVRRISLSCNKGMSVSPVTQAVPQIKMSVRDAALARESVVNGISSSVES